MLTAILKSTARILRHVQTAATVFAVLAGLPAYGEAKFVRGETQYIAALGSSAATSGTDAATWGLWALDPGPRGVRLANYQDLLANAGAAPTGWQFDGAAWWLEEHGLIMEAPGFPLPAGKYVVTGGREMTALLTVAAPDGTGKQAWNLSDSATLYDVTHLGCRAALYTAISCQSCTPDKTPADVFPMRPGVVMPEVSGCNKQDYQVLIVVGMMIDG